MEKLKIENLTMIFEASKAEDSKVVFKDFSLELELGKVYALTGESGIGKSTLAHIVAGHLKANSGVIKLNEKIITKPTKEIIIVHQENDLFPWQNVYEQLLFTGAYEAEIEKLLNVFKLNDCKHLYPFELSGGMKKRLALIRAQLLKPKVLFLDETLGSLDQSLIREILTEMIPLWRQEKMTVVFITHHFDELKEFVDQRISF